MAIYRPGFGPGGDKTRLTDRLDLNLSQPATHTENRRKTVRNLPKITSGDFAGIDGELVAFDQVL
ncbi:MAG: hypothetical protein ACI9JL_002098 [Paracoccaceae bacterium]|jgi:hypothetical protein